MLKECIGDYAAKASEAQVFPKYCNKKTKKLHIDVFLDDFLTELAAAVIQNKKSLLYRPDLFDPEVTSLAYNFRAKLANMSEEIKRPKEIKVDAVTRRLTDPRLFTGSQKHRFNELKLLLH